MGNMDGHKGIFRTLIAAALLTVLYVLAGRFGAAFTIHHSIAAAAWPPAGIALGGLLVFGYRLWPAVFLAAVIVNDVRPMASPLRSALPSATPCKPCSVCT